MCEAALLESGTINKDLKIGIEWDLLKTEDQTSVFGPNTYLLFLSPLRDPQFLPVFL